MKISEIITDKYKLRIPPTVYYELLADVQEVEEEQESRWIPVEERLPEMYEVVMTTRHGVVYPETRLTEYGWEWLYESGVDYWEETDDIEAWMPLPEPYKAETEADE